MLAYTLREFIDLLESAHPELQQVLKARPGYVSKARLVAKKINELISRGESTGVEEKMPKGSSRAYVKETKPTPVTIDSKNTSMETGYKIAIPASLDRTHDKKKYDNQTLGQMQMRVENGDHFLNSHYRVLTKHDRSDGYHFESNTDTGIFPPLIEHDHDHDSWSHIAHVDKLTAGKFRELTKTPTHPKGISHEEFSEALERHWHKNHGKWWNQNEDIEKRMDHIEEHPLVQKFLDHQNNFHMPPFDYRQKGNMGIWKHPVSGKQHIVARDHGFNDDVMKAYKEARQRNR
jgi:hypothetical protein